mgnify:CR=1 FL=1
MQPTIFDRLIKALEKSSLLTDWERGFIESLQEQFNKRGLLSARQIEIFERIETQKLSETAQDTKKAWDDNYDEEKRRIALICAEYYLSAGYFTNLADSVVNDPGFIPSEKAWKKMCENKYAKKVIAEHDAEPKYLIGSVVAFRSTADWSHRQKSGGMPCIVISSGGPIKNAAKGTKPYTVLPYGATQVIECEERHIKKCKNPKKAKKVVDTSIPF